MIIVFILVLHYFEGSVSVSFSQVQISCLNHAYQYITIHVSHIFFDLLTYYAMEQER